MNSSTRRGEKKMKDKMSGDSTASGETEIKEKKEKKKEEDREERGRARQRDEKLKATSDAVHCHSCCHLLDCIWLLLL